MTFWKNRKERHFAVSAFWLLDHVAVAFDVQLLATITKRLGLITFDSTNPKELTRYCESDWIHWKPYLQVLRPFRDFFTVGVDTGGAIGGGPGSASVKCLFRYML